MRRISEDAMTKPILILLLAAGLTSTAWADTAGTAQSRPPAGPTCASCAAIFAPTIPRNTAIVCKPIFPSCLRTAHKF